jgi:hypothetical protein
MNRLVRVILLAVLLGALCALFVFVIEQQRVQRARGDALPAQVARPGADMARMAAQCAAYQAEIATLQTQLAAAQHLAMTLPPMTNLLLALHAPAVAAPSPAARVSDNAMKQYIDSLAKLMNSDDAQQRMRTNTETERVQPIYGSFLADAMLTDKDEQQVRALLVQRFVLEYGPNREFLRTDLTPAQRKEARAGIERARAALDESIKKIVGNNTYATYLLYRDTERERLMVAELNSELAVAGLPLLTKAQQKAVVAVLNTERLKLEHAADYIDMEYAGPEQLTPANIEKFMSQLRAYHAVVRQRSEPVITPDQREVLLKQQRRYEDALSAQVKMLTEMYAAERKQKG